MAFIEPLKPENMYGPDHSKDVQPTDQRGGAQAGVRMNVVKHQFFDALTLIGMRDRLRCPKCTAVGTWKPHGGWVDRAIGWATDVKNKLPADAKYATNRRWLCKFCGYNRYANGEQFCAPNGKKQVWDVRGVDSLPTPKDAVEQLCGKVWPWLG